MANPDDGQTGPATQPEVFTIDNGYVSQRGLDDAGGSHTCSQAQLCPSPPSDGVAGGSLLCGCSPKKTMAQDHMLATAPLCEGEHVKNHANTLFSSSNRRGMSLALREVCAEINGTPVLRNVSALARPGDMLAVMGPSGAGKSTMLNAIMGQVPLSAGSVTLNNNPITKDMRRKMSYVLQSDIFLASLTLRETLRFASMLRISSELSEEEKQQRVDDVVEVLDLKKCLDTPIGGVFMPGLSGGEKKRANIACELLTDPLLMLMDEPTSGLDSAIAYTMMDNMKCYTQATGKTVIVTIHQPSSQIFHMFDNLLLLADGEVVYYGKVHDVVDHFQTLNLCCEPHYNPADFLLEKVKNCDGETKAVIMKAAYALRDSEAWPAELKQMSIPVAEMLRNGSMTLLGDSPQKDPEVIIKPNGLSTAVYMEMVGEPQEAIPHVRRWPTSFWVQYKALTMRNWIHSRNRILSPLKLVETVLMMVFCSILWWQLPRSERTLNDRIGLLFFMVVYWSFVPIFDAVASFPEERAVVNKERRSGAYRLSAYFFAKMTSEFPIMILRPILFISVIYWCAGLPKDAGIFFGILGTVLLTSISSQSIGILIGVSILDMATALTTSALYMLSSMLAGGYYQQNIQWWFAWIQYCSHVRYALQAIISLDLSSDEPFACLPVNETSYPECTENGTSYISGDLISDKKGFNWPIWANLLFIFGYAVVLRTWAYLMLRYVRNPNMK